MNTQTPSDTSTAQVSPQVCDVLVIGGGPAGTTVAPLLREKGYNVVLLEKCHHPRFHIGESLLPANLPLFEKLGVAQEVKALGMPKFAAEFVSPWHDHRQEFRFGDAWDKSMPNAYQVLRADFDLVLINNARRKGVNVVEGCEVKTVNLDMADGLSQVNAQTDTGEQVSWKARFVVDASGRDTVLSSQLGLKQRSKKHNSVALYAHFKNAERREGEAAGNITIFWFDHGWFWYIPLMDNVTSIGMVTWPYHMKTRAERSLNQFFLDNVATCKPLQERLMGAEIVNNEVTATGNFSYSSTQTHGSNYLLLGDAYAFVDPVFSSGVWLAMNSGDCAAQVIDTCLSTPAKAPAALKHFDAVMKKGPKEFSWFIYRVTNPTMRDLFMSPSDKHNMKASLLSLLAGDIYRDTPIWGSIFLLKSAYYLVSVLNWKRTYAAWKRRRFNIQRDPQVEANVPST